MKSVPKIEFGPIVHPDIPHVTHFVPYIRDEKGKNIIMKGHSFKATCCHTEVIKSGNGQIVVVKHNVIH